MLLWVILLTLCGGAMTQMRRFALPFLLNTPSTAKQIDLTLGECWFYNNEPIYNYDHQITTWKQSAVLLGRVDTANSFSFRGHHYPDSRDLDNIHCWSVFTMYWPQLMACALVGASEPLPAPLDRVMDKDRNGLPLLKQTTLDLLTAGLGQYEL